MSDFMYNIVQNRLNTQSQLETYMIYVEYRQVDFVLGYVCSML